MATPDEAKTPPYASAKAIESLFDRMRSLKDPGHIDANWVENFGIDNHPSAIPTMLKWLGVIDEKGDTTTGQWDALRLPVTRADALAPLVRNSYAAVFDSVDVEEASRADLDATFIQAFGLGSTQRYVRCFLALCTYADIPTGVKARKSPPASDESKSKKEAGNTGKKQTKQSGKSQTTPGGDGAAKKRDKGPQAAVSINFDIPSDWTGDQIKARLVEIKQAMEDAGLHG